MCKIKWSTWMRSYEVWKQSELVLINLLTNQNQEFVVYTVMSLNKLLCSTPVMFDMWIFFGLGASKVVTWPLRNKCVTKYKLPPPTGAERNFLSHRCKTYAHLGGLSSPLPRGEWLLHTKNRARQESLWLDLALWPRLGMSRTSAI